jgi:hypothetical protein
MSPPASGELQVVRPPRAREAVLAAWSLVEKHPVRASFLVAAVLRIIAAVVITLVSGYLFPDESEYVVLGRLAAAGHLTPSFWSGYGETLFHAAGSFMWPIVVLFKLFGGHPVVAALWAGLFGAITAALTAVIVGQALGRGWSAAAGLTVAVFPSQIVWSSVVLRESMVWAGLSGVAATMLVGTGLLSLAFLRSWAFLAAAWATALAVWLFRPARPVLTRGLCALLCLVVPLASGLGLAGSSYIRHHGQELGYERSVLSEGAKSAFVHPKLIAVPGSPGTGKGSTNPGPKTAPRSTKVVPPTTTLVTAPSAIADEDLVVPSGFGNDLRALPTGFIAFALRPFPWQHGDGLSYDFAAVEELLYYPLYLLALVGAVAYRRRRDLIAFPLLVAVLVTGIASEAEGNLGSAFRHRDQLFWAVAFFAALGVNHLWALWRPKNRQMKLSPVLGGDRPLTVHASR